MKTSIYSRTRLIINSDSSSTPMVGRLDYVDSEDTVFEFTEQAHLLPDWVGRRTSHTLKRTPHGSVTCSSADYFRINLRIPRELVHAYEIEDEFYVLLETLQRRTEL